LIDEEKNKPFSSRHLKECLQVGAEKFGWSHRTSEVGSMRKGDLILGWGVAAASWGAGRGVCEASVSLRSDGTARVSCGTQDIGTGSYTVIAQVVSDKTGIPVNKIDVVLGSSSLPPGPTSGGSTATATFMPAVIDGANAAVKVLLNVASNTKDSPFQGKDVNSLVMVDGCVHVKGEPVATGVPYSEILRKANLASVNGDGKSGGLGADPRSHNYSTHSFGTQFVEVEWDPGIARLRVSRVVSVIDGGRIINKRTATNQIAGAVVMGVGMGLLEETIYDPRNGHPINDNFADYIVPTIADSPQIDVHFLDIPDPIMNEYGARGIGEIGLAGVAPAITAAVYHATGIRVRKLPVRIEDLLAAQVSV
jgi:xanthine dehydrogenase YagR molybdenum-binding subunit